MTRGCLGRLLHYQELLLLPIQFHQVCKEKYKWNKNSILSSMFNHVSLCITYSSLSLDDGLSVGLELELQRNLEFFLVIINKQLIYLFIQFD